ncbi:hypothetical protein [Kitasatospora sp. NPDC047058]|uniref:hypothetical protein n=1 Tax=Kitasatospora sp. NPDC047058 TaxID=3155620 RepID=UPI00340C326A
MTLGTGTVQDFWARKLLVATGVDPDDLRLDVYENADRGIALAMGGFVSEHSRLVEGAVALAADILRRWRTPRPELVAGLVRCLESRHFHAGGDAAMVLAQFASADSSQDITSAVPALIAAANDSYDRVAGPAALVLARLGHPAALDPVHRWLAASSGTPFFPVTSLGQVLEPLLGCADELLPGIRRMLVDSADSEGLRSVLKALAAWGPVVSEAVPELVPILATRNVRWACDVLGSIGPAAEPAADILEGFVRGVTQPPRHDGSRLVPNGTRRWHGAQNAAWAHWRITGESEVFLAFLEDAASRGLGYADLGRLAELGPQATRCASAVRPLLESPGPWTRVQAAHAWWRITGDTHAAVPVLLAALEPLTSGDADESCLAVSGTSPGSVPRPPPRRRCSKRCCRPTGASRRTSILRHARPWQPSATASASRSAGGRGDLGQPPAAALWRASD